MAELHQLIGDDGRKLIQRLSRHWLHKIADEKKMQYPVGATKDAMIKLFDANNIDVTKSKVVQWMTVSGTDVDGNQIQQSYPVTEQPASARNNVNAPAALDDRMSAKDEAEKGFEEAQIDVLKRENAELHRINDLQTDMMNERLAALEGKKPVSDSSPANGYWALYREARNLGLPAERDMKMGQIEAMIAKAKDK